MALQPQQQLLQRLQQQQQLHASPQQPHESPVPPPQHRQTILQLPHLEQPTVASPAVMAVAPTEALLSSSHTAVLEAALPSGTVGRRTAQHGSLQEQFGTPQLQMQLSPPELPLQNPSNGQRLVSNRGAGGIG